MKKLYTDATYIKCFKMKNKSFAGQILSVNVDWAGFAHNNLSFSTVATIPTREGAVSPIMLLSRGWDKEVIDFLVAYYRRFLRNLAGLL